MRVVEEGVVVAADEEDRDPEVVAAEVEAVVEAEVVVVVEAEAVVEAGGEVGVWIKTLCNANWKSC